MKSVRIFYIGLLVILALQGCATVSDLSSDEAGVEATDTTSGDNSEAVSPDGSEMAEAAGDEDAEDSDGITNVPPKLLYKLLVAEIAGQRGDMDTAVKNYLEVAKETRDPRVAARASQIAMYAKDLDSALAAAGFWVEVAPNNAEARRNLASVYIQLGKSAEAVANYEKLLQILKDDKHPGRGFSIISSQLARESDREMAMGIMNKLLEKRQDDAYALFAQAHLAMRQARFDMALASLDKALKVKPHWGSAIILRSRVLAMQGARADALSYLEKELKGDLSKNDQMEVGLTYARLLTEARDLDKALKQFIRLAELDKRNIEISYYAGILALQLQKLDEAEKYLKKVLKMGKRVQETNYYLGQVAEQRHDDKAAMNRYSYVRHGEFYFSAQLRIVAILADQKQYEKAREQLQTIRVSNSKQRLQLILLEGDLLREAKRYPDAKDYYTRVLDEMPNETSVRYARALIAEKLGELDLLESDLQTILKQEPANAQVLNALGYTLADRTNRYEEAFKYIQRAFELEPDDAAVVDSMGWVEYRMGHYKEAIEHLRRANDLSKDPEIAAHLGEVLWTSGDKNGAMQIWEGSLKDNPKDKALLDVMKKFGL